MEDEDTPSLSTQQILTVQTSNVTITTSAQEATVDVIKCTLINQLTNDENDHEHLNGSKLDDDDENKENNSTRQLTIITEQPSVTEQATSTITFHATAGNAAKMVLEKSSSISLFPGKFILHHFEF